MSLNELTDDMKEKLPPTDSRFRPDVRELEEGRISKYWKNNQFKNNLKNNFR